eukprot:TRINITY_DN7744_c0_g1_i1.p2 TRINITY_DN7744_c0_g1~~TRINITY_DN7744_c0_g1_i1.p2  ORF type:complete len:117 (-),score=20.45 TRINITY_DN7744_c0_g1_i1:620-970(-)
MLSNAENSYSARGAEVDIPDDSSSESESEFEMEVSHAFSDGSSNNKDTPLAAFTMRDVACVDEVEDGASSYASFTEDDADGSKQAKTDTVLEWTARVLWEGTRTGEPPMLGNRSSQ